MAGMQDVGSSLVNAGAGIADLLIWVVLGVGIAVVVFIILYVMQFRHKIIFRNMVRGGKRIQIMKFREYKDKQGTQWWQLLNKERETIPIAPSEVIDVDTKGNIVVEAYRDSTGSISWVKDTATSKLVPDSILKIENETKRKEELAAWSAKNKIVTSFEPVTTADRVITVNRIMTASQRKTKTLMEQLPLIVSVGALVIMIVALLVFYEDMGKPLLAMGKQAEKWQENQIEMLRIMADIKNDIQTIKTREGIPAEAEEGGG